MRQLEDYKHFDEHGRDQGVNSKLCVIFHSLKSPEGSILPFIADEEGLLEGFYFTPVNILRGQILQEMKLVEEIFKTCLVWYENHYLSRIDS